VAALDKRLRRLAKCPIAWASGSDSLIPLIPSDQQMATGETLPSSWHAEHPAVRAGRMSLLQPRCRLVVMPSRESAGAAGKTCAVCFRDKETEGTLGGRLWPKLAVTRLKLRMPRRRAVVVAAAVDWTGDERHIAVTQIFRLPGLASSKGLIHRLSQLDAAHTAKRDTAFVGSQPSGRQRRPA